jgi:hypothetical protein
MLSRFLIIGLVFFLLGAGGAMFLNLWMNPQGGDDLPVCPYLETHELSQIPPQVVAAVGAYEAIRETLLRDSLEGVSAQAEVIARTFEGIDPKISSCAKRLADSPDVESACRAFIRLNRLMEKHAEKLPAS